MFEIKHYLNPSGGDKRSHDADITKACDYLQDWQRRTANRDEGR
jgi:hypothetical protein